MAGFPLIGFGFPRLGSTIRFIPHPLITGFTAGIAVIIASGQVKDAFGLRMGTVPAEFFERWSALLHHAGVASGAATALTAATIVLIALWPRVSRRVPGPLIALLL